MSEWKKARKKPVTVEFREPVGKEDWIDPEADQWRKVEVIETY